MSTNTGRIFRIDNFDTAPSSTLIVDTGAGGFGDIAVDPVTGRVLAVVFIGVTVGMDLVEIDLQTGTVSFIATLNAFTNALEFNSVGELYGRDEDGNLNRIDPDTGAEVLVATSFAGSAGDLAMDLDGTILGLNEQSEIDRTDLNTGVTTVLSNHGLAAGYGIEVDCDGTVYIASDTGNWYTADVNTGVLNFLGNFGIPDLVYGISFLKSPDFSSQIGIPYCSPGNANSTGAPGEIIATGSTTASSNDLTLTGTNLPNNQFAYFIGGRAQGFIANPNNSQGNLCVIGSIARFNTQVGAVVGGEFSIDVDLTNIPEPPTLSVAVMAGETWNFQCWHRDFFMGAPTSNFTDAVEILFD